MVTPSDLRARMAFSTATSPLASRCAVGWSRSSSAGRRQQRAGKADRLSQACAGGGDVELGGEAAGQALDRRERAGALAPRRAPLRRGRRRSGRCCRARCPGRAARPAAASRRAVGPGRRRCRCRRSEPRRCGSRSAPARQRSSVDLPAPLGPAIEITSPAAIVKLTDRSAARVGPGRHHDEPPRPRPSPGGGRAARTIEVSSLPARRLARPAAASRARRAERSAPGSASIGPSARPARMAAASIADGASASLDGERRARRQRRAVGGEPEGPRRRADRGARVAGRELQAPDSVVPGGKPSRRGRRRGRARGSRRGRRRARRSPHRRCASLRRSAGRGGPRPAATGRSPGGSRRRRGRDKPEHRVEQEEHEEEQQGEGRVHQRRARAAAEEPAQRLDLGEIRRRPGPCPRPARWRAAGGDSRDAIRPAARASNRPRAASAAPIRIRTRDERDRDRDQRLDAARIQHPAVELHHVERRGEEEDVHQRR